MSSYASVIAFCLPLPFPDRLLMHLELIFSLCQERSNLVSLSGIPSCPSTIYLCLSPGEACFPAGPQQASCSLDSQSSLSTGHRSSPCQDCCRNKVVFVTSSNRSPWLWVCMDFPGRNSDMSSWSLLEIFRTERGPQEARAWFSVSFVTLLVCSLSVTAMRVIVHWAP